ncbi:putative ubx domain protein [Erysiphe neolycopersici]|uniref:Putative ubx domain protein n=1 Tax=Erysiphe neolycopersici TaxID=212602 RepID=A0A420I294_9PEZI|nr:putative ubx domain protein [Erysiphe neolycopersici]
MTSNVVVIDTSFRRATIKVTSGTYLTDVLDEACRKFNVQSKFYDLKYERPDYFLLSCYFLSDLAITWINRFLTTESRYKTKSLDLFQTFRQSGLASGARLELVLASRSPTPVSVALQLPAIYASIAPNCRIVEKYSNDTTIWMILRKFESIAGDELNITARGTTQDCILKEDGGSQIFYEIPVLNVMGRELSNFEDFQKTLRQLGFSSGTCLIKLDFKKTNQLLEEAKLYIQDYFHVDCDIKQENSRSSPRDLAPIDNSYEESPNISSKEQTDLPEDPNHQVSGSESTLKPIQEKANNSIPNSEQSRSLEIFAPSSNPTPIAATIPYNDADFEPTIAHAKLHQSRLQNSTYNKRLLSDLEKERLDKEKDDEIAKIPEVSIKIRFPDQSTVVFPFGAEETGSDLYKFTVSLIDEEERNFKLIWHNKGPQIIPKNDKKLVRHLGFQNRMLVNFAWDGEIDDSARKKSILKPIYAKQAREVNIPTTVAPVESEEIESTGGANVGNQGKTSQKVGKWFKGLIKK